MGVSANVCFVEEVADIRRRRWRLLLLYRVSDAGPAWRIGALWGRRPKPSGKEPAAGGDGVAIYGDLAVGGVARAIPASANESTGNRLPRSERGRCGLRRGDLGMMLCIARTIVGDAVTGLRHRKRHPPAG